MNRQKNETKKKKEKVREKKITVSCHASFNSCCAHQKCLAVCESMCQACAGILVHLLGLLSLIFHCHGICNVLVLLRFENCLFLIFSPFFIISLFFILFFWLVGWLWGGREQIPLVLPSLEYILSYWSHCKTRQQLVKFFKGFPFELEMLAILLILCSCTLWKWASSHMKEKVI